MMQSGRMASLVARKAQLDVELQRETSAIYPNQNRLSILKRQKLMIKDQLQHMARSQ